MIRLWWSMLGGCAQLVAWFVALAAVCHVLLTVLDHASRRREDRWGRRWGSPGERGIR